MVPVRVGTRSYLCITPPEYHFKIITNIYLRLTKQGFPCSSDGKESASNAVEPSSIPGLGISPSGGLGKPLQYSCLENPYGQKSLGGYSPWGHKDLDMTEQLHTGQHQ